MIGTGTFRASLKAKQTIERILDSGRLSYGEYSQQFEAKFATLHKCNYGILSNSGTSSLLVALQTLKEVHNYKEGDEVIVPALTFVATVNIVLQSGLKPVLIDVEPDYYGLDPSLLEKVITRKTKCIIPVHTFGQPANMNIIWSYLDTLNDPVHIIEDSCESMFVKHNALPVGAWSDISCFSMYMSHLITTGVGGIAITNNEKYSKILRSYVNHGMLYSDLSNGNNFTPVKIHRDFAFSRIGHSFRITELEAALGLVQLEETNNGLDIIRARNLNADYLSRGLKDLPLQLPQVRPNTQHAYMMYPIILKEGDRDNLTKYLNEKGISTRRMLPLINQPVYKNMWDPMDYPVANYIDKQGFYIGCHQHLTVEELDYIIETITRYFTRH